MSEKKHTFITEELVEKMKELKGLGLTNSQIAKELGVCNRTVAKRLGNTPLWSRSQYGSMVSHVKGTSYIPKNLPEPKVLKVLSNIKTIEGRYFIYRIDSINGTVSVDINYESHGGKFQFQEFVDVIGELSKIQCIIIGDSLTDEERLGGKMI